ncbi:MAG: nitrogen regulation protein NR(I), partial [Gammaproteobacteria bacterium SG8_15]
APELLEETRKSGEDSDWENALRRWANQQLSRGEHTILHNAVPRFEQIMIETALQHTGGRRQDAAKLLGWGRNTLTRKIKELGMEKSREEPATETEE